MASSTHRPARRRRKDRALTARRASSRGKAPLHNPLTQSSHSAIASRGLKVVGLKLNSTQRPSSKADKAMAAGRNLNLGASPEIASWPNKDSRIDLYLP